MKKLLLLLCITTVAICNVKAQSSEVSTGYLWWIDQGISAHTNFAKQDFLSFSATGNYYDNKWLYKLRFQTNESFEFFSSDNSRFTEIGFMMGKAQIKKLSRLSVSAGAGVAFGDYNEQFMISEVSDHYIYIKRKFFSPALLIEGEASLTPLKYFGIGLFVNANVNTKIPIMGIGARLSLGNMRYQ